MTRDEWNHYLETATVTANQRGAIMHEFARLGVIDRAERLAICAALLGLDELRSTSDLVMGQAGRIVNALQGIADRAELAEAAALPRIDDRQPSGHHHQDYDEPGYASPAASEDVTWPQAITRLIGLIYATIREGFDTGAPATSKSLG